MHNGEIDGFRSCPFTAPILGGACIAGALMTLTACDPVKKPPPIGEALRSTGITYGAEAPGHKLAPSGRGSCDVG